MCTSPRATPSVLGEIERDIRCEDFCKEIEIFRTIARVWTSESTSTRRGRPDNSSMRFDRDDKSNGHWCKGRWALAVVLSSRGIVDRRAAVEKISIQNGNRERGERMKEKINSLCRSASMKSSTSWLNKQWHCSPLPSCSCYRHLLRLSWAASSRVCLVRLRRFCSATLSSSWRRLHGIVQWKLYEWSEKRQK